ncbi:glycoside hydrolase family 3 N-terminal domain-containing protein [Chondrinema litorale]|uniref:glycoside hydrolase family 3 N-terminal domain-containing protein n=1 Tax=Chondrinema litorale TaxID=2994555 RepID=UPI002542DD5D|nr:glycoside hydrolase family 3 N-terminal domain-containing protein [Chondrinema litorale]UZR95093.1 glycoside hydrolase family 3 C-terminal domain-containing protein [Chondrinema litorale]
MKIHTVIKILLSMFIANMLLSACSFDSDPQSLITDKRRMEMERTNNTAMEEKIEDLLGSMTLEEKIGQMTQINNSQFAKEISTPASSPSAPPETLLEIDTAKLIYYLDSFHIGSFLNGIAVPAENWYKYSKQLQEIALRHDKHGIPIIYGVDHMHGANYLEGSTIFPHSFNIGATFDTQFSADEAYVLGLETADLGHHWIFAPVLDVGRNPYWPRFYETYSEDPYLAASMGAAYVKMLQEHPQTAPYKQAATAKHYIGYSDPDNGWDRTPATIDKQQLYEFHIPSFKAVVDAGIKSFMINGGEINSIPVHASYELLTYVLRDQLGFKGVVVTDWEDVIRLHTTHKVAKDMKEATFKAIMAGIDMSMTPYTTDFCGALKELVEEKVISMDRINLSVSRILRMKMELGLWEHPFPQDTRLDRIGRKESKAKARKAAEESLVLIKNEGILPLTAPKKIVVAGHNADSKRGLAGGWSLRWITYDDKLYPEDMPTVYTALQDAYPNAQVQLADQKTLKASAAGADAIIIAAGEEPYSETPGNFSNLELDDEQLELIKTAQETGKPVILLMIAGRPRTITDVLPDCDAFIWCGLPGFEGGTAIANVISGKVNPSGKMSFSYPAQPGHWFPYNHKNMELFFDFDKALSMTTIAPFGYGLSYTSYKYSDLTLSATSLDTEGSITASVTVTNTGNKAGREAVLWFISDEVGTFTRPVKALKHFEKLEIAPGEAKTFTFKIDAGEHLSYPNTKGEKILEPGDFTLRVGDQEVGFVLE